MLSIAEALQRPLFRHARVVAGQKGITRIIGWVHIVDIKNAHFYTNRNDLILSTGFGLAGMEQREREEYLKQLIQHGVAGLCIELGDYFSQLPPDMLEIAERHDFPLIVFTQRIRFVEITQDIHSLLVNNQLATIQNLAVFSQETRFLRELLTGTVIEEEQARERIGIPLPPPDSLLVMAGVVIMSHAALRYEEESSESIYQDALLLVRSLLRKQNLQALLMLEGKKLYILCLASKPLGEQSIKGRIKAFIREFEQSILQMFEGNVRATIGFGQVKTLLTEGKKSLEEAEETIKISQTISGCYFYEDLGIYQIVSKLESRAFLHTFITEHLGVLLEYDRSNNAQLLGTLRVYLKHMGSKQLAAKELFIHRQTLYHRLEKCRELLGDDYLVQDKRLCIETAILFYDLLQEKFW